MSSSAEQIYASFDEIATIAQMSSSNLQNVASASEEQLATIEEVGCFQQQHFQIWQKNFTRKSLVLR